MTALLLLLLLGCGPVPGGVLAGTPGSLPVDWSQALRGERGFCEIESRPEDRHSIQLECFVVDEDLYVQSHRWALADWWPTTSWAAIWLAHPDVRVRIENRLYELRAVRVEASAQREAILADRGYDPVPDGIVLFRFEPRA